MCREGVGKKEAPQPQFFAKKNVKLQRALFQISYSFCRGLNEKTEQKVVGSITVLRKYLICRNKLRMDGWMGEWYMDGWLDG